MVIPLIISHDVTADRFFRAPRVTCVASLAMMLPHGSVVNHLDVIYRANFSANSAAVAVLIGSEASVRQGYELTEG